MQAQDCGCADEGNCPLQFTSNASTQVCYEFTDAFNNDLASPTQGVCGVYIKFTAGLIGELELTLTSPAGQQVQLVGTSGNCSAFTPLATWDILFVPCATTPHPDSVGLCYYPLAFNTCPSSCPWGSGVYDGQYHPFNGCLENFNTGPINGQWCIEIENAAPFNGGRILEFEIIPCDDSGQLCCDADAGNLPDPNVTACIGDPALDLDLDPVYGAIVPDPLEYGYTFAVFSGGNLYDLDTNDDFTTYPAGSYTICGLSYLLAEAANLPALGSPLTPQSLNANLTGPAPAFCGDIGLNCVVVNIGAPPPTTVLLDTICEGETVLFDGQNIGLTGTYRDTLNSFFGCDSIVNLQLTVLPNETTNLSETICFGDTLWVGGMAYTATGMYTENLFTGFGCDSTVNLSLTVLPEITTTLNEVICQGETFAVGNSTYSTSGTYVDVLASQIGCDSTVTLTLTVVQTSASIAQPGILTCQQTTVPLVSTASTSFGTLSYLWTTVGGQFSSPTDQANATATAPGTYTLTVTAAGCSSTASVVVQQQAGLPSAVISPSANGLTCDTLSISLDGNASTPASNLAYAWEGSGGTPLGNGTSISTALPGTYALIVTDQTNQCRDTAYFTLNQDIVPPVANAGPDMELSCADPTVTLSGMASGPSGNITFSWSTADGNLLPPTTAATATADQTGTYELIVQSLANGCRDTDLVVVTVDVNTPNAIITLPQGSTLNCEFDTLTLDGSSSTGSPFIVYQWVGNILTGQGTPIATTNTPGVFTLKLIDTSNGCTDSTSVTIGTDFTPPNADAGPDDSLTCSIISVMVGGSGTSTGPDFIYEWTSSPGGAFLSPLDQPTAIVNEAAIYNLTVTDTTNGCTDSDFTVITRNETPPVANAGPDYVLNCTETSFTLDASGSTIVPFASLLWTNSAGDTISNDVQVAVNYADTFVFAINLAFCTSFDTVIIAEGTVAPVADAGPDQAADCNTGLAILEGSNSDNGFGFELLWTALNGSIAAGETTTTPTASAPGEYVLQVTNTNNGCISTDTVLATLDPAACTPLVDAGADGLINCAGETFTDTLSASATTGPNISYNWTAIAGTIEDQSDPFAPIVRAGEYVFTVTNTATGLLATDTVLVTMDTISPVAVVDSSIVSLTCPELEACFPLDATGSSVGPQFAYFWEAGQTGTICTDPSLLNAEVLGPDVYTLTVTNLLNGCSANTGVLVRLLDFPAIADAGPDAEIHCGETTDTLDGSNSSISGIVYTYEWTSVGGTVLANGQTLYPEVMPNNASDVFTLIVTNTLNMCRDTDEVVVFAPVNCDPECAASVSGPLDCNNLTVSLLSTGSSTGSDIGYQWTTSNGSFCGGENTATACADAAGIYVLTVTRNYPNGAISSSTCQVQVLNNGQPPTADAGPDANLTCENETLTIGGNSSAGQGISYQWTTLDGSFCGSNTTASTACVDEPGTYNLLVINSITGCSAMDEVLIGVDTLHPVANAGPDAMITCNSNTVVLNGSAVPTNVNYHWTTPNGDICAGENTPSPVVCSEGTYILTVTIAANGCTDSDIANVSSDPNLPMLNTGPDLRFTCADTVFTINATATSPNPLGFQWVATNGGCIVGPDDVLQVVVNCIGTYTLTATDLMTGCPAVSVVEVVADNMPPDVNLATAPEINCQNLTVTLDASASLPAGQLGFAWATLDGHLVSGQNSAMAQVDSAGTYTVTVTNLLTQCTATGSLAVTRDADIPVASAGADSTLTCTRNSLILNGLGSSTSPDISYEWTTMDGNIAEGDTSLQPTIDEPGTYLLTVTDNGNGCVVSDAVTVTLDTIRPIAAVAASQGGVINCFSNTIALNGNGSSPAGLLGFFWETGNGEIISPVNGPAVQVGSDGSYLLTVTNLQNGCTDTMSVAVVEDLEPPVFSLGDAPMLTCVVVNAQLSVLPNLPEFDYEWSGPGTIQGSDTPNPLVNSPGIFSVTVTDTGNGCESDSNLIVTQNLQAPTAVATSLGQLDCDNLTTTVSGTGSTATGVSYAWTTAGSGNIASPNAISSIVDDTGVYYLTVTRLDNGCTATDFTAVAASSLPIENAVLRLQHPDCLDPEGYVYIDSVIGGAPPYFYSVDGDVFITFPQFSYLEEGPHFIVIKDENGCVWTDTVTLLGSEEVLVELGPDVTIVQGEDYVLEAQLSIPMSEVDTLWWTNLPDSTECPQCLSQPVAPVETTTYRIHVVDTNGCAAMDKITVRVEQERPFFVPTAFSPNGDGINDRLFLYAGPEVAKVLHFRIFDRWGNLVFYEKDFDPNTPQFGWDGNFEGQPMNPAVFVWVAEMEFVDGARRAFNGDLSLLR